MRGGTVVLLAFVYALAFSGRASAQDQHAHAGDAGLGTVHFETSCVAQVAPQFDRGIALLHSFEFAASVREFEGVLAADSTCAMAWWGIALSRWSNPMVPNVRPAAIVQRGLDAVTTAQRLAPGATARERSWIAAVAKLFADADPTNQPSRMLAYEQAMAKVAAAYPSDLEARIFHAIAIVGAADAADKTYANQRRAGAILERLFREHPDHPGLAHYIIHSYDVPALAEHAAAAAERYADIAPATAHALHMPSHTFTRLGMWEQSVRTNLRSMAAAEQQGSLAEAFHAADYAVYAYLQLGQDSAAYSIVRRLPALAERFDPSAVTGAAPGSAGLYALAAVPARYAVERGAWEEASRLPVEENAFPYTEGLTWFARGLGAARTGNLAAARAAVDSLAAIEAQLKASNETYWAGQVEIQRLSAGAWLDLASGREDQAVARMREAPAREAATETSAVSPGPLAPALELLGDMLLELGRPAEARAAYEASLKSEPERRRSFEGLRRIERTP